VNRVLLLSTTTGYQLRAFDEASGKVGVQLRFATDRCHSLDDPWRDHAIAVRFHEEEDSVKAIVDAARVEPIHGVLAVGDRPTVLAARAAMALGLPGNPPDAACASGNKQVARARFAAAGLRVPWHVVVPTTRAGADAADDHRIAYPCVLKPIGLSGSRGVIRADSPDEFRAAFDRIRRLLQRPDIRAARTGSENVLLVEGFIPGREVAIEGLLTHGALQTLAVFDKPDPLDGPFFEETIYVTPSSLDDATQASIVRAVADAIRALGLTHGPVHAECRVDGRDVTILEVAARPIGGLCSRVLRFTGDASLEEVLIRHAIGEDVSRVRAAAAASAVMMIPIPRRGHLKRVLGEEAARAVRGVEDVRMTAKADQLIEPLPEAGSYLGFIFARGTTPAEAVASVREAHGRLAFVIEREIPVRTHATR
jgi:biotin carboxylase